MAVINTNITSLIGQQNLNKSQSSLQTAMERLSSGLRINSAKDDAAGQAIANRMSAQVTGLNQASRNANDGISVAQTAEGALDQINDNLQRVRELTVQAQNGTNSPDDLDSIQKEINQRLGEIDRISGETAFNGTKLLDGSSDGMTIQVGANDGETISFSLGNMDAESLDLGSGTSRFNVNGSVEASFDASASGNAAALGSGDLVSYTNASGATAYAIKTVNGSGNATYTAATISATENADGTLSATVSGGTTLGSGDIALAESGTVVSDSVDVATTTTTNPLSTLDAALKKVDTMRSDLGAIQNRFDSAIDNISTTSTNLSSARSRIEDADYAQEVSNMTRAQILQQAGTSVLAQANQTPQSVLSLLQ